VLSPEEVDYIRDGLKRKWDEINHQYQQMTHLRLIDTTGLRRRKQNYESELKQIEDDIKKLNKAYIFVE
jgi:predicted GTPase